MSVKLRLTRMGRKKRPFYRIVAADSRARRDGKYLEKIGTYNPLTDPAEVEIDKELALKWLERGAELSPTVRNFMRKKGILFEYDLRKRGLTEEQIALEYKKWEVVQMERRKKEEAVAAMKKRDEEKEAEKEARAKAKEEAAQAEKEAVAEQSDEAPEAVEASDAAETVEASDAAEAEATETAEKAETDEAPAEDKESAEDEKPEKE